MSEFNLKPRSDNRLGEEKTTRLLRQRLKLIERAGELKNVSRACRELGVARSTFYLLRQRYQRQGQEGLVPPPRRTPNMPNRLPEPTIAKILELTRCFPSYSYVRIAHEARRAGCQVSAGGVRRVWERHKINSRRARYLWLEQEAAAGRAKLTPKSRRILHELKERRNESE